MRPVLSVAICAREDRHRLTLCLEGLALEGTPGVEIVVVNDGGPPLDDVLESFAGRLALRADRLDPPSAAYRLAAARNRALRLARADRVLFLDQDCVAGPGLLAAHTAYGGSPVAVTGVRRHLAEPEVAALRPADVSGLADRDLRPDDRMKSEPFREASGRVVPMAPTWVTGCHVSVPAPDLRAIGGYWEALVGWGYEDVEMALRLGRAGCSIAVRTDLAVVHLDHPSRFKMAAVRRNRALLMQTERDPAIVYRGPPLDVLP